MKKNRILKGLLLCMLMVICLSTTVFASYKYKLKTGKTDKWLSGNSDVVYKVKIPSGVYIKAQIKEGQHFDVFCSYKNNEMVGPIVWWNNGEYYYLEKGTYYFHSYYSFRLVTKKAPKNYANYCLDKSRTLGAGKQVVIIQTQKNSYNRWYKIKLKRKKKINIWATGVKDAYGNINALAILNTDGEELELSSVAANKYRTNKAQPAGTYYICVGHEDEYPEDVFTPFGNGDYNMFSCIYFLKWK